MTQHTIRSAAIATALAVLAVLTGCAVGPEYQWPEVEVPPAFKESAE